MTIEIISQLGILLFAGLSAWEEEAFTFPFREIYFDEQTKFRKLKTAHRAGAVGVLILLALIGFIECLTFHNSGMKVLAGLMLFSVCGLWYWLVFDIAYAVKIHQNPFYLGNTPEFDGWMIKTLGKNPGLKKALFCVLMIIAINLVYVLLLY